MPVPEGAAGPALLEGLVAGFERAHAQPYGYVAPEEPIQAVTFRLQAAGLVRRAEIRAHPPAPAGAASGMVGRRDVWLPEEGQLVDCPIYDRDRLGPGRRVSGPAIVEQPDATTLLLPGQAAAIDPYLNLIVQG